MTLTADVKALEDKVAALQAKADTLDKVQALLAGPVQLSIPVHPDETDHLRVLLERSQKEVNRLTEQVSAVAQRGADMAIQATKDRDSRIAELEAENAKLRHDAAKAITKAVEETEDAEAARTQDKLLADVARELGVDQLEDASGNESGDPLDFTSDAITITIRQHLTDPLHEVLQRLQAAERIDLPEDELGPVAAVRVVDEAIAGLLEDLECATVHAIDPKLVAHLDAMLADTRNHTWDLTAKDRMVLRSVREYLAGPAPEKEQSTISPGLKELAEKVSTPEVNTEELAPGDPPPLLPEGKAKQDAKPKKKRSKKKPPADAFTSAGYVLTKVNQGVRGYVRVNGDENMPCTSLKADALVFKTMTEGFNEKKRLNLKAYDVVPTDMVDELPPRPKPTEPVEVDLNTGFVVARRDRAGEDVNMFLMLPVNDDGSAGWVSHWGLSVDDKEHHNHFATREEAEAIAKTITKRPDHTKLSKADLAHIVVVTVAEAMAVNRKWDEARKANEGADDDDDGEAAA